MTVVLVAETSEEAMTVVDTAVMTIDEEAMVAAVAIALALQDMIMVTVVEAMVVEEVDTEEATVKEVYHLSDL